MVIKKGKQYSLTTPPNYPGQNIGEKINIYTQAKKIPNSWQNRKKYKPPHTHPNILNKNILTKIYIYTLAKRMVIYRRKGKNYKPPL